MTLLSQTDIAEKSRLLISDHIMADKQEMLPSEPQLAHQMNYELTNDLLPLVTFIGLEIVLGFFGNLLVLYVYIFRYRQTKFRYFVLCLSVADTVSCLTSMPLEIVSLTHWYVYPGQVLCEVKSFFVVLTACSEALCLFVIAIDRYRKVCVPLGRQITPGIAKRLCLSIYLVALFMAVPFTYFWKSTSHQYEYDYRNITVTTCGKDPNKVSAASYAFAVEGVMSITLVAMLVLYTLTARRLLAKRKQIITRTRSLNHAQNKLGTSSIISVASVDGAPWQLREYHSATEASTNRFQNEAHLKVVCKQRIPDGCENCKVDARIRRMTIIMLILTTSFIITAGVYLALLFFLAVSDDDTIDKMSNGHKVVMSFFLRLYFINHVVNPIVYVSMDPHFRKTIKKRLHGMFRFKC